MSHHRYKREDVVRALQAVADDRAQRGTMVEPYVTLEAPRNVAKNLVSTPAIALSIPIGGSVAQLLARYQSDFPDGEDLTVDAWLPSALSFQGLGTPLGLLYASMVASIQYDIDTAGGAYREILPLPACGIRRKFTARSVKVSVLLTSPGAAFGITVASVSATITRGWTAEQTQLATCWALPTASTVFVAQVVPRFTTRFRVLDSFGLTDGFYRFGASDGAGNVIAGAQSATDLPDALGYEPQPWPAMYDVIYHKYSGSHSAGSLAPVVEFIVN